MAFEFATATEVVFGRGSFEGLGGRVALLGRHALVVTGSHASRTGVAEALGEAGVEVTTFTIAAEPTTAVATAGVARAREAGCDVVVGVGGGSVLDGAKAVAALLTNGGEPLDYLEVIGAGRKIEKASAPFVAVPTTSGTGSEVTRNAVLASPEHQVKVSLRSILMLPRVALLDPTLTVSVPPDVTAEHGPRCPHAGPRALRLVPGEPVDRRLVPRRPRPGGAGDPSRVRGRQRSGGARGHGAGEPVWRHGTGQRRAGRGSRVRGAPRRHARGRPTGRCAPDCSRG